MAYAQSARALPSSPPAQARWHGRELFFKTDHPRAIDRYIDYFGGLPRSQGADGDPCGERLLDTLR